MKLNIKTVAVIGTGILGTQIAMLARFRKYEVFVYDAVPNMLQNTIDKYRNDLKNTGITPYIPFADWEYIKSSCNVCNSIDEAIKSADLIIECVSENLEVKRNIFRILGEKSLPHAILATNSSSYPISYMEMSSGKPEYCINTHFYHLLTGKNMVDIMGGTSTKPEVFDAVLTWVKSLGMVPLSVKKEVMGFCFNRVWRAVKKEALYLWGNGYVDFRDIDRAWMIFTGMKQGPFGIMDRIGLDTINNIEWAYYNNSHDPKDIPPEALKDKINRGELGIKTGQGFYTYPDPEYIDEKFLKP